MRPGLNTCDLLYGHEGTCLLLQPSLPGNFNRKDNFADSGWHGSQKRQELGGGGPRIMKPDIKMTCIFVV